MLHIPEHDRELYEKYIFLPMVIKVLNRDLQLIEKGPFKLKQPYVNLIEHTLRQVQMDLRDVKFEMKKRQMKVYVGKRDDTFSEFTFVYNGFEEPHNYFNPRIRNYVEQLLKSYLLTATADDKEA